MYHELNVISKEIEVNVPTSRVFEAWTEPAHLTRWFTDGVDGWPGLGSTLTLSWKRFGFSVPYKITEMKPSSKVILKTRLPGVGTQVLTVELARRAPKTIIKISESGPQNHESDPKESGVDSGWEMTLGLLKNYLESHWGSDRETFFAMLPAQFEFDHLRPLFQTTEGLKKWLIIDGEAPTEVGQEYKFQVADNDFMTGTVLAFTHHEMALSWKEIDGYFEMKSFPTGGDNKGLCLRGATYSPEKYPAAAIEAHIKDLLVKLFAALAEAKF